MVEIDFPRGSTEDAPSAIKATTKHRKEAATEQIKKVPRRAKRVPEWITGRSKPVAGEAASKKARSRSGSRIAESGNQQLNEEEKAYQRRPKVELLNEGVRGLGIITQIADTHMTLEWAGGIKLHLPANQIGQLLNERILGELTPNPNLAHQADHPDENTPHIGVDGQPTTLRQLFSIGQELAFKVTSKTSSTKKTPASTSSTAGVHITTCPYELNSHLALSSLLHDGLVLNGAVASIEEKGVRIDLGLANASAVRGFIPADQLPLHLARSDPHKQASPLECLSVGQVLLVRVVKQPSQKTARAKEQRVIQLSGRIEGTTEEEFFPAEGDQKSAVGARNQLMPGCIIATKPVSWTGEGHLLVDAQLGGDCELKALIQREHLPPSWIRPLKESEADTKSGLRGGALRAVCIACEQNSPLLLLCAHPDVVAVSRVERRLWPDGVAEIGKKLSCKVYEMDKQHNAYFRLSSSPEMSSPSSKGPSHGTVPVALKALRVHLDEDSKLLPGSEHLCRVIGRCAMERMLLVATKKSWLRQKIIAADEARPGQLFTATISAVKSNGLAVRLDGTGEGGAPAIKGFIAKLHLPRSSLPGEGVKWQRGLAKDQHVQCRVLYYDETIRSLVLTAKPALVDVSDGEGEGKQSIKLITQVSPALLGHLSRGMVIGMLKGGSCLVAFFNRVVGLLRSSDAQRVQGGLQKGMVLSVKVMNVDVETGRMLLGLAEDEPRKMPSIAMTGPPSAEEALTDMISATVDTTASAARHLKSRRAKPFQTYQARIVGPWPYGGTSPHTSAELMLPGRTIGRLHCCELQPLSEEKGSQGVVAVPMDEFLTKYGYKQGGKPDPTTVEVKVICVGRPRGISKQGQETLEKKFGTSRFVECTMLAGKLADGKRKLRLINYRTEFAKGERVSAFIDPSAVTLSGHLLCGEVNPLFKFTADYGGVMKIEDEEGECKEKPKPVVSVPSFLPGQQVWGTVEGVNRTRRGHIVQLHLENLPFSSAKGSSTSHTRKLSSRQEAKAHHKDNARVKQELVETNGTEHKKRKHGKTSSKEVGAAGHGSSADPGFDWSLSGYSMADLAGVALNADKKRKTQSEEEPQPQPQEPESRKKKAKKGGHSKEAVSADASKEAEKELPPELSAQLSAGNTRNWVNCINYFVDKSDVDNARAIAERALSSIDYSKEAILTEVWSAYLNLEVRLGTKATLKEVFSRACSAMDSFTMHKRLLDLLKAAGEGREDDTRDLFESALRKFRHTHLECWFLYADYLYSMGDVQKARELLERALQCLDKKQHLQVLSRFAQLEYRGGDLERGRTMFEKLLHSHPKRTEMWSLYADVLLKCAGIAETRSVFERAVMTALNPAQLYKKWLEAEQRFGDEASQNEVRERMLKHLDVLKKKE